MKLPHQLPEAAFFLFSEEKDFRTAIDSVVDDDELLRINNLLEKGLMPVTSKEVLATMFGVNPGIIWSFIERPRRYYRSFTIPKGKGERQIFAPKVGLKIIQKWIATQLQQSLVFADHVYGFVPGRSHLQAAKIHTEARWVYSIDIEDFFPTTPKEVVVSSLQRMQYDPDSAGMIASLCCFGGFLAQGAPSSPVLSNLCMTDIDGDLARLATKLNLRLTRYADDITFSSCTEFPAQLPDRLITIFADSPWKIADAKTHFAQVPKRLKVHGLMVNGPSVKLTKGYRNRLRAYRHILNSGRCKTEDIAKISGHLAFAEQVNQLRED